MSSALKTTPLQQWVIVKPTPAEKRPPVVLSPTGLKETIPDTNKERPKHDTVTGFES